VYGFGGRESKRRPSETRIAKIVTLKSTVPVDIPEELRRFEGSAVLRQFVKEIRPRAFRPEAWRLYEPGIRVVAAGQHALSEVVEASKKALGLDPYPEQIAAALVLLDGKVCEIPPGEGKTLALAMAAAVCALKGDRVHVFAANDFLAAKSLQQMSPLFEAMGIGAAFLGRDCDTAQRIAVYAKPVVYTTATAVATDYLCDHFRLPDVEPVQGPLDRLLMDDIDTVLLDRGRTHFVITSGDLVTADAVSALAGLVARFESGKDYRLSDSGAEVSLLERGVIRAYGLFQYSGSPPDSIPAPLATAVALALQAHAVVKRGVDYEIVEGQVQWLGDGAAIRPPGLRSAIEAKEGLPISEHSRAVNWITMENLVRMYHRRSGIGGAVVSDAQWLKDVFQFDVIRMPGHFQGHKVEMPDLVFTNLTAKERAVAKEVDLVHSTGRPILVVAEDLPELNRISELIHELGIPHQTLTGFDPVVESRMIEQAGIPGSVTLALLSALTGQTVPVPPEARALGGLATLSTHRNQNRRADQRFRGIAGRQAAPGKSRFFVSIEDSLMTRFGFHPVLRESRHPVRTIDDAQLVIESELQELEKQLQKYEGLIEEQRRVIVTLRKAVASGSAASLLEKHQPPLYQRWEQVLGPARLRLIERELRIDRIDDAWSEYLAWYQDYISRRDDVTSYSGEALRDFQTEANRMFSALLSSAEAEVVAYFDHDELPPAPHPPFDRNAVWTLVLSPTGASPLERNLQAGVRNKLRALGVLEGSA